MEDGTRPYTIRRADGAVEEHRAPVHQTRRGVRLLFGGISLEAGDTIEFGFPAVGLEWPATVSVEIPLGAPPSHPVIHVG